MQQTKLVCGLLLLDFKLLNCEVCQYGKQTRTLLSKQLEKLIQIHSLCET